MVALRSREPWEAIDLGAAMIRAWWWPVYGTWLAIVLPLALALSVLLASHPLLALILIWWFKPLYDRVILHVVSQAVFGSPPRIPDTVAHLRTLIRSSGLVGALTLRRLDPARSFNLPVRQLELQQGKPARMRERLLGRRAAGQATGLLYACLAFEGILVLSLNLCVDLLTPAGMPSTLTIESFFRDIFGLDDTPGAALLQIAFAFLAITIVEPIYVASGFALYLNRRTTLEAWDLEIAFRRMDRPATHSSRFTAVCLGIGLLSVLFAQTPQPAWAASPDADSKKIIREVLAAPDFEEHKTVKAWRPRQAEQNPSRSEDGWMENLMSNVAAFLKNLALMLSELGRVAGYVAVVAILYIVVRFLLKSARSWHANDTPTAPDRPPPETLFGLDVRLESLPENLADMAAEAALRDPRLALSLLYRGALATLMHRDGMPIEVGDTEGDCLHRVRRAQRDELTGYFARLVTAWSQTAYGGKIMDASSVRALCADWSQFFGPQAAVQG